MEKLELKKICGEPKEEYVTVTLQKSRYDDLFCMENHPILGYVERDETAMGRANYNKELYPLPDVYKRRTDVPKGKITGHLMEDSKFYPGVKHKYWTYTPAGYNDDMLCDLILFLDGEMYFASTIKELHATQPHGRIIMSDMLEQMPVLDEIELPDTGDNVTDMLDNMIAEGTIPPTIAVFITPGYPGPGEPVYGTAKGITNRSIEYDTVSDWFARFIKEEFLPIALEGLNVTKDPKGHSTVGISSSGIAGFNVAWYDNDLFNNPIVASPSFGNIRNGNIWPSIIRTSQEKKDLKACFCVGRYDADIIFGDWILADKDVASALNYKGYDFRLVVTQMGHSLIYLKYMLPQALEWIYHGKELCGDNVEIIKPYPLEML